MDSLIALAELLLGFNEDSLNNKIMAIFDGKLFKGTVGNYVFKTHGDLQVIQARPRLSKNNQTKGTRQAASAFGIASRLAREFRHSLGSEVTRFYDGKMVYRLNSEVGYVLRQCYEPDTQTYNFATDSFSRLEGFEFNGRSPLRNSLFISPEITITGNTLRLRIPEFSVPQDLKFPKEASYCTFKIGTCVYDLQNCKHKFTLVDTAEMRNPSRIAAGEWEFEVIPGSLCMVMMSLQFVTSVYGGQSINDKTFSPAAIISAVMIPGTPEQDHPGRWRDSYHQPFNVSIPEDWGSAGIV